MRSRSKLVGGRLCLDFVNTVRWRGREEPIETLRTIEDLLAWSVRAGVLSAADVRSWKGPRTPHRARELREAIYRLLVAWVDGRRPKGSDVSVLNASMPPRDRLVWNRGSFGWKAGLDRILAPVAWSTADLLTEGEPSRLRRCGSEECAWFFYDESRNGKRRWCSMSDCGNREKARRHYARKIGES